jgi:hypothetical protein
VGRIKNTTTKLGGCKMFIKNYLVVFPWNFGFKQLIACPHVKRGNFRIGQRLFETKFRKSFIIIAKEEKAVMFDVNDVIKNMSRKIAEADTAYLEGMTCPRDYINQLADIVSSAHEDVALSSCAAKCDVCKDVCDAQ